MKEDEPQFKLSYTTNSSVPCPVLLHERDEQKNPQCVDGKSEPYADEKCGCDMNELRVFIPDGYPCHRIHRKRKKGEKDRAVCIPREIPGLSEAINDSQYFRWANKITRKQVKLWVQEYYYSHFRLRFSLRPLLVQVKLKLAKIPIFQVAFHG